MDKFARQKVFAGLFFEHDPERVSARLMMNQHIKKGGPLGFLYNYLKI